MTKATRIISLNLGSQTIGLAEFQAQPQGGLVLQNYRLREVLIDPASEDIRHPQISAALREMMAELQIRHEAVNYAVSAQSVFARFEFAARPSFRATPRKFVGAECPRSR